MDKTIQTIQNDLAKREAHYQASSKLNEVEEEEEEVIEEEEKVVIQDLPLPAEIEILQDDEKQSVLDDEYSGVEGKIALKLRSTSNENNVVVIRMPIVYFERCVKRIGL